MKIPNPLKQLLVNDEEEFLLYLKEWEIEALNCALDTYKKLLQQKGGMNKEIEGIGNIQRKIDISYSQGI